MREPEEIEQLRLAETPSMSIRNCGSAKLDEPRLVGMKGEPEACEPCLEIGKEPLCLVLMLKADDGVVRIAHDNDVARIAAATGGPINRRRSGDRCWPGAG